MNGTQKQATSPSRHRGNSPMVIPSASPTSASRHRERSAKEATAPLSPNHASEAETEILGLTPEKKRHNEKEDEAKRERGNNKKRDFDGRVKREAAVRDRAEKSSTTHPDGSANAIRVGTATNIPEDVNKTKSVPSSPSRRQKTPQLDRSVSTDDSVASSAKISDRNLDGSKKRKHGYERTSSGEPPRQKQKSDTARSEGSSSGSRRPSLPTALKIHKRAASMRSNSQDRQTQVGPSISQAPIRKDREDSTNISTGHAGDAWNSDSSDQSFHHAKTSAKQSSSRSQVSPVRTMPQIKKRVDRFGVSIFARHCEKGDLEAAKQALEQSPDDIDEPDYAKNTPLQKASLEGHVNVVKFLISTGKCNINNANTSQDTPLIDAVENGHLEVVKLLLASGADPHLQNKAGSNPYDVIDDEDEHSEEIMAALREAMQRDSTQRKSDAGVELGSARSESQQNSPALPRDPTTGFVGFGRHAKLPNSILHMESTVENLRNKTAEGDQVAVYELLIRRVKPDNACGVAAARGGHEFILNLFIDKGLDMDPDPVKYDFETPMLVAIGRGHLSIVDLLLKQDGFDPTRRARRGQTYYELAEERRGPNWQKESDMLKETFDRYVQRRDKAFPKQKNSSPRSSEKDKNKKSPHRDKTKEITQRPALTHSRTSSGNYIGSSIESGAIKSEPSEASNKVADLVPKKMKRRGSEPGTLTEPAERRRKLVQAKDLQRLKQDKQKLNGDDDSDEDEGKAVLARASESPKLNEYDPLGQKQKSKGKVRRLSNHDRAKSSSEAMSRPSSGSFDPQKIKAGSRVTSGGKEAIDNYTSSETRAKPSAKHGISGKSNGDEKEGSQKLRSKAELMEENKAKRKEVGLEERKRNHLEETSQLSRVPVPKDSDGGIHREKRHPERPNTEKNSSGKGATERMVNNKEAIERDGKTSNSNDAKSRKGGNAVTDVTKIDNNEDRTSEDYSKKGLSGKTKASVNDDVTVGDVKERPGKNGLPVSAKGRDDNDKNWPEKQPKEEPSDRAETNRPEKDSLEKESADKQRREKEKLEKDRIAKETEKARMQKERAEKETRDRERAEKERQEKELAEKARLVKEKLEKQRLENEKREKERVEKERLAKERDERERLEKERVEKERVEEERLEKERLERERLEKERLEKQRLEKERLENERLEKERLEKERLENERLEKERQEKEKLEKERLEAERLQKLEDERKALERQNYLATLPPSLRQALTLGSKLPIRARGGRLSLSNNFLPLYVVRLVEIDPSCQEDERQDPWILNFQAAVILGQHDMHLTQHPSWRRHPMTHDQRRFFLQGYDIADLALLQRHPPHSAAPDDPNTLIQAVEEAKALFMQMQPLFWISLADFLKAIPQHYPRLRDVKMRTLAICHVDYVEDPEFGLSRRDVLEFKRDNSKLDVIRRVSSQNLKAAVYVNGVPEQVNGSL